MLGQRSLWIKQRTLGLDLNAGLIGWWPLDDTSATDYSGYQRNGTWSTKPAVVPGIVPRTGGGSGNAFSVNGSTQTVTISMSGSYVFSGSWKTLSIALWVNLPSIPGGEQVIVGTDLDVMSILIEATGKLRFDIDASAEILSTTTIIPNRWYHVVGTFDGTPGNQLLYVNGVLDASQTGAVGSINSPSNFYFGSEGGVEPGTPTIDDVRLYGRVLSAAEIGALYASAFQSAAVMDMPLGAAAGPPPSAAPTRTLMGVGL